MTHILVRRDQFNITPDGILHKPTDSRFVPSPINRYTGTFRQGRLCAPQGDMDAYDADEVKKMMLQLWAEYVAESSGTVGRAPSHSEHNGITSDHNGTNSAVDAVTGEKRR
ncbi:MULTISPECIES: hypothetical protein [unclassified Bradyrhizobium]|uniref:hypothetical protein n=1 Tax=unclassified Bradyrhizobium TaxID=2631580 RepID=UPI00247A1385|nr:MULTISPECIES: hypothetical protein [unclassified Bradyrhizobium]WGR72662.1 hypothetical protein MTX24_06965 [Bradyrhizobium sp. ISRA426]WGR77495.1 hypothetical protein MTX21_31915 [Bradyrhizobium sp. ISRA430]WGR87901.1 hypothetical protein MTX25_06965 [Bradyrhizobium sp. ISRA432]